MNDTAPSPEAVPVPTPAVVVPDGAPLPAPPAEASTVLASRYAAIAAAHAALLPKAQEILEKALKRELVNDSATDNALKVALALVTGR